MMVLTVVLYTIVVLVAILLIGLVLIQQSKGGGFGSAFGGAGESVFGAQAGNHLTKLTVILTTIFFVLALTLAIITGHRSVSGNIDLEGDNAAKKPAVTQEVPKNLPGKTDGTLSANKLSIPVKATVKDKKTGGRPQDEKSK